MLQTLFGLILLLCPFLLLLRYEDKKLAFACILSSLIAGHLAIALLTQAFGIFRYPVVVGFHGFISLGIFFTIRKNVGDIIFSRWSRLPQKVDWVLVAVAVIAFAHLYRVHYDYTGKYTVVTTPEYQEVRHMRYPYPYFADEWYAIALIKDSIASYSLPFRNPLDADHPRFLNFEFAFHSLLAELMVLLGLDPLTGYTILTIFSGLLICLLVYLFLAFDGVVRLPAALAALAVLYITNGANLAGIWTLIPLILGIICLLLNLFFFAAGQKTMIWFMAVLTILFYPPLVLFYTVAVIPFLWISREPSRRKVFGSMLWYPVFFICAGIMLLMPVFGWQGKEATTVFHILLSKIFPPTFPTNSITHLAIWHVIPLPAIVLSFLGIVVIARPRPWLAAMAVLGLLYWAVYSQMTFRFILDYPRVVVTTSILLTLIAGFGLDWVVKRLRRTRLFRTINVLTYAQIGVLVFLLLASGHYTQRENWQNLKLSYVGTDKTLSPAAPANQYLHPDDLRIFKDIKGQEFVSLPWKGTVIGVATDNYPDVIKAGTISTGAFPAVKLERYLSGNSDCGKMYERIREGKEKGMRDVYRYLPVVYCQHFEIIDQGREGFYLYKFKP